MKTFLRWLNRLLNRDVRHSTLHQLAQTRADYVLEQARRQGSADYDDYPDLEENDR
jgi:hypothetical protein